jgi:hypothetical protein
MIEITGNLWDVAENYNLVCITTNGVIDSNGLAIMGRGCAGEAAQRYPQVRKLYAERLKLYGHRVQPILDIKTGCSLLSFPTKQDWRNPSSLDLIQISAQQLMDYLYYYMAQYDRPCTALLPRPGCSNGQLSWSDVKPVIEPVLDDCVTIISFGDV